MSTRDVNIFKAQPDCPQCHGAGVFYSGFSQCACISLTETPAPMPDDSLNPGQTHYEGRGHQACALAKLDAMCDAAQSLLMLLDEWAWTAHRLTQSPGIKATVAQDDMIRCRNELWTLVAAARAQP